MATNQTEHYNLNQWELSDSVVMEEFNADNAKIEQALLELKASLPKFQSGSYMGTGTHGADNPMSLTFDFTPQLVLVMQGEDAEANMGIMTCVQGFPSSMVSYDWPNYDEFRPHIVPLTWADNTLSWQGKDANRNYNQKGLTYYYLAIG